MLNEVLRSADEPKKKLEKADVRKEAEAMVNRHERQLSELKTASEEHPESFEEAALKASEQFQQELRDFLKEHDSEELYEELVKPVRDQVSKIMGEYFVNSAQ